MRISAPLVVVLVFLSPSSLRIMYDSSPSEQLWLRERWDREAELEGGVAECVYLTGGCGDFGGILGDGRNSTLYLLSGGDWICYWGSVDNLPIRCCRGGYIPPLSLLEGWLRCWDFSLLWLLGFPLDLLCPFGKCLCSRRESVRETSERQSPWR